MKKLLKSFCIWFKLFRMGYNFSGLYDRHDGFYRLNYEKGDVKEYAILDIDFSMGNGAINHPYSHIHGGQNDVTIFRVDAGKITSSSKKDEFKQTQPKMGDLWWAGKSLGEFKKK